MKILHYSLGLPPNRTGGLVSYSLDLAEEQSKTHDVSLLYPGELDFFRKKSYIKNSHNVDYSFKLFELVNSLPLPIFGGISEPEKFMRKAENNNFDKFFEKNKFDVLHIHSLMGLYDEIVEAARNHGVRVVFTSHDYFGIAPEPTFFFANEDYSNDNTPLKWGEVSKNALSVRKLRLFQFRYYHFLRKIVKKMKNKKNIPGSKPISGDADVKTYIDINSYNKIKSYYKKIFSKVEIFHFNSQIASQIYEDNLDLTSKITKVIPITNKNISLTDTTETLLKQFPIVKNEKLKVAYIGPNEIYKGFEVFVKFAQSKKMITKYEFHTFGYDVTEEYDNIIQHGKFKADEKFKVYNSFDLLIVPSIWKETFGLVVLEALSQGKIVFVSSNVGSKDILNDFYIFDDIDELILKIQKITSESIPDVLKKICNLDLKSHEKSVERLYLSE